LREWAVQLSGDYLPDGWLRVSSSVHSRVAVNPALQLYYKEYLVRSPAAALRAQVKGSRATRARLNADALLQAGIDAPHNVLWGQLPGGGEYLFTVEVPGDSIRRWLSETLAGKDAEQRQLRRQLLFALGTFIGRVHATGFIHGELRPDNVLADLVMGQFRFSLINNEGNRRSVPTPGKLLLRNLVQLNQLPLAVLGRTDRMRFLCAWRRQMRDLSPVEGKILAAEAYRSALRTLPAKTQ
jgi:Lipopolysaccharide kinase (Kdo/WaaP) family